VPNTKKKLLYVKAPHMQSMNEAGHTGSNDNLPLCLNLVLVSTRYKLDRLGNSRRFFVLGLGLEQYLGGLCASEYDKIFPVGIRLEISRERRGPSSRLGVDRSGRSEETGGVASILQHESESLCPDTRRDPPSSLLHWERTGLTGFELVIVPRAFAAATDSSIRPG
jgi:hypothetical protein